MDPSNPIIENKENILGINKENLIQTKDPNEQLDQLEKIDSEELNTVVHTEKYKNTERDLLNNSKLEITSLASIEKNVDKKVHFIFKKEPNTNLMLDFEDALDSCPILKSYKQINNTETQDIYINMPEWFNSNELMEYYSLFRNISTNLNKHIRNPINKYKNNSFLSRKFIQMASFFQNNLFINKLIQDLLKNINIDNALIYLGDSYSKLSVSEKNPHQNNHLDPIWFDLFINCLDFVSVNFLYYLNSQYEELLLVNNLLLEEIIEK